MLTFYIDCNRKNEQIKSQIKICFVAVLNLAICDICMGTCKYTQGYTNPVKNLCMQVSGTSLLAYMDTSCAAGIDFHDFLTIVETKKCIKQKASTSFRFE